MAKSKAELTREWIMLMLFQQPQNRTNLIANGCKVMVFGHEYEEFVKLSESLIADNLVTSSGGTFTLTEKGIFIVKKQILIPLINLTDDASKLDAFMKIYREKCDVEFLGQLSEKENDEQKTNVIKEFAKQNYDKIASILWHIPAFLANIPK